MACCFLIDWKVLASTKLSPPQHQCPAPICWNGPTEKTHLQYSGRNPVIPIILDVVMQARIHYKHKRRDNHCPVIHSKKNLDHARECDNSHNLDYEIGEVTRSAQLMIINLTHYDPYISCMEEIYFLHCFLWKQCSLSTLNFKFTASFKV